MRTPPTARLTHPIVASHSGRVTHIDNRRIARLAKLAGAPDVPAAGMRLHVSLGDDIIAGQPLLTLHAQSRSEEHTSELQSLMRISYAVFCLKKKKYTDT